MAYLLENPIAFRQFPAPQNIRVTESRNAVANSEQKILKALTDTSTEENCKKIISDCSDIRILEANVLILQK